MSNQVEHPKHYTSHPSGIECWDVQGQLNNNVGCAFKYVFRRNHKDTPERNIEKAIQFLLKEKQEIVFNVKHELGIRWMVQPTRAELFLTYLAEIGNHERLPEITEFYTDLDALVTAKTAFSQMWLIGSMIGRLGSYLTTLDEISVREQQK